MMRTVWAAFAAAVSLVLLAMPRSLAAQAWNDARTRALVARAVERRAAQLADTALQDYTATARGYVTFLAQLGEGLSAPPRVVRADQLALQVYWKAPDLSKQVVEAQRDTLLLPTDIAYHRDHLGIVQNNFPSTIRLGEGDEVRDVPHPLSAAGLAAYDFAIRDSLRIRLPDRAVEVYEVRVRPRESGEPRMVGSVYLDRATAEVVRMTFDFTRAAYLDRNLEDVSVVIENALVENRFWLPSRQEIEVRRTGTWLDFPARGIIRGRWEICCYQVNRGLDRRLFAGPEIVFAPPAVQARYPWRGAVLDSLPSDVRAVTGDDVRRVQEEARALVRAEALERARGTRLAARRVSDFARVNRVQGLALGAGAVARMGRGVSISLAGRYGLADEQVEGRAALALTRASGVGVELFAAREYRDVGDVPEVSLVRNSIAAQEFGSDYTDPYDVRQVGVGVGLGRGAGVSWRLEGSYERQDALAVHARPATGRYEPTINALALREGRIALRLSRPASPWRFGTTLGLDAELRGGAFDVASVDESGTEAFGRFFAGAQLERPFGAQRLVVSATSALVRSSGVLPPQELVYLGGPVTAPGYGYHSLVGEAGASARVEWRSPVPFASMPLGRFGRAPGTITLAPYAALAWIHDPAASATRDGVYPSVGVGALVLFDLLRVDVARGLRDGRWMVGVDVARAFWSAL